MIDCENLAAARATPPKAKKAKRKKRTNNGTDAATVSGRRTDAPHDDDVQLGLLHEVRHAKLGAAVALAVAALHADAAHLRGGHAADAARRERLDDGAQAPGAHDALE